MRAFHADLGRTGKETRKKKVSNITAIPSVAGL